MPKATNFAEFCDNVLTDPRRFAALLGFWAIAVGFVIGGVWLFLRVIGVNPTRIAELQISPSSARILVSSVEGNTKEYLVVVHPHGWQPTEILVRRGDRLSFSAAGSINVDLPGIISKVTLRHDFEQEILKKKRLNPASTDVKSLPESYFKSDLTGAQLASLRLARPWTGPEGIRDALLSPGAFAARIHKRVMPDQPLGGLIGGIGDGAERPPETSRVFFIGRNYDGGQYVVGEDGELWLNVNDVWDDQNQYKRIFYEDNIGAFWAKVTVLSKN